MSRVLIIEPDEALRMLYAGELDEEGYEVVACADCSRAMISIQHKRPDLVLADISASHFDQTEFLCDVRDGLRIPVILCSIDPAARTASLVRSLDAFVVKDSRLSRLKRAVRDLLGGSVT